MEFLAKHIIGKKLKDDALKIGEEARSVEGSINCTLGQYEPFDTPDFVKEVLYSLNDRDLFAYSASTGGKDFEASVLKFLGTKLNSKVVATPGGTGAISATVNNFLDKGETILFGLPCWKPYYGIAELRQINVETFDYIANDKFNLDGFIKKANEIIEKQHKLVFILNDPCHNPTGYSLSIEELNNLINYLNNTNVPVVIIYDCAYIDLSNDKKQRIDCFNNINNNVLVAFTVSFSKTFQVYGQRIGALVLSSKNDVIDEYDSVAYLARNTWSNTNKAMISLVNKVLNDNNYSKMLNDKLDDIKENLNKRASLFIKEAKEVNLKIYPYSNGYFISIPVSNPNEVANKLKQDKIFVLPVCNVIRVAICGLKEKQVKGLATIIKKYVD